MSIERYNGVRVRQAYAADAAVVHSLLGAFADHDGATKAFTPDIEQIADLLQQEQPQASILLAEMDDEIVGILVWVPTFKTRTWTPGAWVEDLFIRDGHRRRGVGRALMMELRSRVTGRIEWTAASGNKSAAALYRSLGATPIPDPVRWRWEPVDD